nr:VOC family protein [Macrococcus lamae]
MPEEYKMPEEVAKNFVMNASFTLLDKTFMASDTWGNRDINNEGAQVCFIFDGNDEEAVNRVKDLFQKAELAGCKIPMPLGPTEWTNLYGSFTDPFGVSWMASAE